MSNLHKIGNYGQENREIIKKFGKNRNYHIVSIDTASAPLCTYNYTS